MSGKNNDSHENRILVQFKNDASKDHIKREVDVNRPLLNAAGSKSLQFIGNPYFDQRLSGNP